jgi:hypothetical protein
MRRHDRLELGQEAFLNNLAAMLCGALAAA